MAKTYSVLVTCWDDTEHRFDVSDRNTAELTAEKLSPMNDGRFTYSAALEDGEPFSEWEC